MQKVFLFSSSHWQLSLVCPFFLLSLVCPFFLLSLVCKWEENAISILCRFISGFLMFPLTDPRFGHVYSCILLWFFFEVRIYHKYNLNTIFKGNFRIFIVLYPMIVRVQNVVKEASNKPFLSLGSRFLNLCSNIMNMSMKWFSIKSNKVLYCFRLGSWL